MHHHENPCSGPVVGRRSFVAGGLGGLLSLAIPAWQARAALADAATNAKAAKPKSCILLWMNGGPSHLDTFDPKPGAATGGPFKAIDTSAPGVQISEHLPRLAANMDKLAVIRSISNFAEEHDSNQSDSGWSMVATASS